MKNDARILDRPLSLRSDRNVSPHTPMTILLIRKARDYFGDRPTDGPLSSFEPHRWAANHRDRDLIVEVLRSCQCDDPPQKPSLQ